MTVPRRGRSLLGRLELGRRWVVIVGIVGPVVYAFFVNWDALVLPPAWDSATTVSPAALTMVELDFDILELARLPGTLDGGPSTHATSLYTIGLAGLIALFGPETAFFLAHVSSILLIGGLTGATYLLGRERLNLGMAGLVAGTVGTLPIILQQGADIYLDLPLAIVTTLAVWAAVRRRFWITVALAGLGVALKASGVFLIPLLLLAKPLTKETRKHLGHVAIGGLLALVPFIPPFLTTDRFDTEVTDAVRLSLLQSSASMLILTIDVFLVLVAAVLVSYGRARGRSLDRVSKATGLLLGGFIASYLGTSMLSGTIAVLPRYYIVVLPAVIVLLPPKQTIEPSKSRAAAAAGFLSLLLVFSVVNRHGDYYQMPDHPFFVLAERSTRAQDLLQLQVDGTRMLAATGLPVVVGLQEHFRLTYPDMGYVTQTPDERFFLLEAWPEELPDSFAMLVERRFANPVVAFEEWLIANGEFHLDYQRLQTLGFYSDLVVATRR